MRHSLFFLVPYIWIERCSPLQAAEKEHERSHYEPLTTIMLWNIFYPNTVCFTFSHHLSLLVFIVSWDTTASLLIRWQIIPIMCPEFHVMMMILEGEKKPQPTAHSVVQTIAAHGGGVADHVVIDSSLAVSHSWWQQWRRVAAVEMKGCLFELSDCNSDQDMEVRASGGLTAWPEARTDPDIPQTWNTTQECMWIFIRTIVKTKQNITTMYIQKEKSSRKSESASDLNGSLSQCSTAGNLQNIVDNSLWKCNYCKLKTDGTKVVWCDCGTKFQGKFLDLLKHCWTKCAELSSIYTFVSDLQ